MCFTDQVDDGCITISPHSSLSLLAGPKQDAIQVEGYDLTDSIIASCHFTSSATSSVATI